MTINNDNGNSLSNLVLKFTGGSDSNPILGNSKVYSTRVNPKGESGLIVEFTDSEGKRHSNFVNVYIEHNYGGRVDIKINTNREVKWVADIRL